MKTIKQPCLESHLCKLKMTDRDGLAGTIEYGLQFLRGNHDAYFKITAWFGRYGGCCHDEILAAKPELKPFVDLHLSDTTGAPMYALENAKYHAGKGKYSQLNLDHLASHLRITKEEAELVADLSDEAFAAFVDAQRPRWQAEADAALVLLGLVRATKEAEAA